MLRSWKVSAAAAVLGALVLMTSARAAGVMAPEKRMSFAPVPAWVDAQQAPLEAKPPASGLADGRHHLLADQQVRVVGSTLVDYRHTATRAVNERGVEDIANVQITFDPSYQSLQVHRIVVRRDGREVSRVAPGALKLLQRESSLESLIYDGRITAHVALKDVRVGDVVETVYSRQGSNPVFGEYRFGSFDFDWGVPVALRHARLLWPQGRPLYWKLHNGAQAASVTPVGAELDHRWRLRDVPARMVDDNSPGWYDPYVWAEWGEFPDWAAVSRWALPLYRLPEGPMPAVDREVARIAAQTSDPEQRLLAALRFVQREVRYLGIEMGVNSHAPHGPELVLDRRFGDCKDKTLLSLALLRGLGIPARPALVHTGLRHVTAERLPTPWAFNHVLVQADLGGRRVWLDPTRAPQGGKGVAQWVQSDFGRALLVSADTRELVPMAGAQARTLKRELHAVLDASAGFDKPATLTVTTRAEGEAAEQLRQALATQAQQDLQKQYLDFYAASYPGLAVDQPFTSRDDAEANVVELVEHYRMPAYWVHDEKRGRWTGDLEVPDLLEWLRRPKALNREGPLALRHPVDFTLVSEYRLPKAWDVKPDNVVIEDPAFVLKREEVWRSRSTVVLTDRFQTRADHVPASGMAAYVAQLDKARSAVAYNLYHPDGAAAVAAAPEDAAQAPGSLGGDSPHWLPLLVGLAAAGGLGLLMQRLYRWDPHPAPQLSPEATPWPLGGWLWLPLFGLAVTPLMAGSQLVESLPAMTVQRWSTLTLPSTPGYHPLLAPVFMVEFIINLALVAGAPLLLLLAYQRRSNMPMIYIGWMSLAITGVVLDAVAAQVIPAMSQAWTSKEAGTLVRTCVFGGIWIAYFLHAERVQRTFVLRREARPTADAQSLPVPPA
ncbi:DUF3857 domain-containing protein [Roseateles puraquae]|uniref:Transglutaminase n=1 Tax=Roseateles puraquae TaxID=431059 RepID=A0A254N135_9BURK|nr:DUF3857 domain-containing protein [Roseateles puraquae]MDG0856315.1 DUF3857 domain-containing protein [Roseateles puraquae]OWR01976.1 hypothetical protein CDO81_21845 [Roseateles puraquae]